MLSLRVSLPHCSCSSLAFRATGALNGDNKTIVSVVFLTAETSQWSSDVPGFSSTKSLSIVHFIPSPGLPELNKKDALGGLESEPRAYQQQARWVRRDPRWDAQLLMKQWKPIEKNKIKKILWSPSVSFIRTWIIAFQIPQVHNKPSSSMFLVLFISSTKKSGWQKKQNFIIPVFSIQYPPQSQTHPFISSSVVSSLLKSGELNELWLNW